MSDLKQRIKHLADEAHAVLKAAEAQRCYHDPIANALMDVYLGAEIASGYAMLDYADQRRLALRMFAGDYGKWRREKRSIRPVEGIRYGIWMRFQGEVQLIEFRWADGSATMWRITESYVRRRHNVERIDFITGERQLSE